MRKIEIINNVHKCQSFSDVLNVHLVDVVSGGIVTTITHRRVKGPVNIVHSENWLVYSYYNDKVRRTELSKFEWIKIISFISLDSLKI